MERQAIKKPDLYVGTCDLCNFKFFIKARTKKEYGKLLYGYIISKHKKYYEKYKKHYDKLIK